MSGYPYRNFNQLRIFPKSTSGTKFLYRTNYPVSFNEPEKTSSLNNGIVTSWTKRPEMIKSYWQAPLDNPKSKGLIRGQGCQMCKLSDSSEQGYCKCDDGKCKCENIVMGQRAAPASTSCGCPMTQKREMGQCNCGLKKENGIVKFFRNLFSNDDKDMNGAGRGCGCGSESGAKCGCMSKGVLNLLDPKFNLREVCKHSILLEDHLFQKEKRCRDCCMKHLLAIEAFLEEAITLDKNGEYTAQIEQILKSIKEAAKNFVETDNYVELGNRLREVRKGLMAQSGLFECGLK